MDVHPPLFYFLLKIWSGIFGSADFAMRFMSVLFGAIAIIFAYQFIKRHFGVKAAAVSALAMALSPMLIRYGQEMRMYTLVAAIVFAATYFLSVAVDTRKKRYWIIYGVLLSLGMWVHYFVALAWLAHFIWLVTIYKKKIFNKDTLTAYILAVILYLPWIYHFVEQALGIQGGFWIGPSSANTLTDFVGGTWLFMAGSDIRDLLVILLYAVSGLTIFLTVRVYKSLTKSRKSALCLLLSVALIPPVALLILSTPPLKPLFVDRYLVYSSAGIALLAGFVIIRQKSHRIVAGIAAALYLTASIVGIVNVNNFQNTNAKGLYYDVSALSDENIPIISNSEFLYYDIAFYGTPEHPTYFIDEITGYIWGSQEPLRRMDYGRIVDLDVFLLDYDTFWYVGGKPEEGDLEFPREGYIITQVYETEVKAGEGMYQAVRLEKSSYEKL